MFILGIGSMRLSRRETPSGSTRRRGRVASDSVAGSWLELRALHARADRTGRDDGDDGDTRRKRKALRLQAYSLKNLSLNPDGKAPAPLILACAEGNFPIAEWLLEHGDGVSDRDAQGRSPIHVLSSTGNLKAIKWLFAHGAKEDLRSPDKLGRTPMHAACYRGDIKLVQWLVDHGGRETLYVGNKCGTRPINLSFYYNQMKMVHWLIQKGVWYEATDSDVRQDTDMRHSRLRDMIYRRHIVRLQGLVEWVANTRATMSAFFTFLCGAHSACTSVNGEGRRISSHLRLLNGHGGLYKRRIAAFVGLVNARELIHMEGAARRIEEILTEEARWRLRPEHVGLGPHFGCRVM